MSFQHVLLTGAAGGIGSALARGLRRRHPSARLSLVDRDLAGLQPVCAEVDGHPYAWDLADPAALEDRVAELPAVDLLVNCAGIMEMSALDRTPWATTQRVLDVDLVAPMRLMSLVVPGMVRAGRGGVINVSSLAGLFPLRGCTAYGAAKAGLAMASEVARLELQPAGIQVLTVYPGPVATALERRARAQVASSVASRWLPVGQPEPLADQVLEAFAAGASRVVFPGSYRLAWWLPRVATGVTRRWSPAPRA
jgi:short-subunit dehydrogenase